MKANGKGEKKKRVVEGRIRGHELGRGVYAASSSFTCGIKGVRALKRPEGRAPGAVSRCALVEKVVEKRFRPEAQRRRHDIFVENFRKIISSSVRSDIIGIGRSYGACPQLETKSTEMLRLRR
jgi:hypothetical protein